MLIGALISVLNGAIAKVLSQEISAMEIVFFRNMIGVMIIFALLIGFLGIVFITKPFELTICRCSPSSSIFISRLFEYFRDIAYYYWWHLGWSE